jgi:hypothetical protein
VVWPDNWPAFQLFSRMSTQWRVGMNGPIGLDYNVVFHEIERAGTTGEDYDDLLASIRTIEGAALEKIHEE